MIVQCPSCASRYRVNDANVPSSGGKITCPSCQHKFIVYPEEQNPAAGGGADSNDLEDKTSVAFRPDLNKLVNQMQGGGGDDGVAATEVMSGDNIPDFLAGQNVADDGTVEMQNPFDGGGQSGNQNAMGAGGEDAMATEVVSGDMLDGLGFEEQKRDRPKPQSPPSKPPSTPQNQVRQQSRASQPSQPSQPNQAKPQPPTSPQTGGANLPKQPAAQPSLPSQPSQPSQPAAGQSASSDAADASFEHADGPAGPNPQHDGPWKLKTNFGLTYEFPDTKSLSNWLSNREDLDGYSLSGDGENFHGLDEWPQISGGGSSGAPQQTPSFQQNASPPPQQPSSQQPPSGPGAGSNQSSGGGSGAAGMPGNPLTTNDPPPSQPAPPNPSSPTGKKIQPNEYRPPSRDGKWNVLLWGIAFLLMLVVGALCVQLFGIYDIKGDLLGMKSQQAQNQATEQTETEPKQANQGGQQGGEEAPDEEQANKPDPKITKEVTRLVTDARRAVENNRLQTAAEKLQNAKLLDPKRVEVYELLATVYGEMGQKKEAEAAEKKVGELKAAAQGADGSPGDDDVAGEEASKN